MRWWRCFTSAKRLMKPKARQRALGVERRLFAKICHVAKVVSHHLHYTHLWGRLSFHYFVTYSHGMRAQRNSDNHSPFPPAPSRIQLARLMSSAFTVNPGSYPRANCLPARSARQQRLHFVTIRCSAHDLAVGCGRGCNAGGRPGVTRKAGPSDPTECSCLVS